MDVSRDASNVNAKTYPINEVLNANHRNRPKCNTTDIYRHERKRKLCVISNSGRVLALKDGLQNIIMLNIDVKNAAIHFILNKMVGLDENLDQICCQT